MLTTTSLTGQHDAWVGSVAQDRRATLTPYSAVNWLSKGFATCDSFCGDVCRIDPFCHLLHSDPRLLLRSMEMHTVVRLKSYELLPRFLRTLRAFDLGRVGL